MGTDDVDKWALLVAKLISDTRSRTVKWRNLTDGSTLEPISLALGNAPLKSYFANFDDKGFRMDLANEKEGGLVRRAWRLSIASSDGKVVKRLPSTSALSDLARAIEDQLSQVDEFLDKYLKS